MFANYRSADSEIYRARYISFRKATFETIASREIFSYPFGVVKLVASQNETVNINVSCLWPLLSFIFGYFVVYL